MSRAQASEASGAALGLSISKQVERGDNSNNDRIVIESKNSRIRRMKRAVPFGAQLHTAHVASAYVGKAATIMATCTYRKDVVPSAKHISACLQRARMWATRRKHDLRYVWTAELTKRGVLHYHVLFFLPPGVKLPLFDKCGWWPHGSTRLEWARNGVGYISKYASKGGGDRAKFPKGFRLHGCGGLNRVQRVDRRYHLSPSWVRELFTREDCPKPLKGGGWISCLTGEWQASPFFIINASPGRAVVGVQRWYLDYLNSKPITQEETQ